MNDFDTLNNFLIKHNANSKEFMALQNLIKRTERGN